MSTSSALGLSPSEEAATAQFMSLVNEWRSVRGFEPVSSAAAVKFLMARKFSVDRALALYQQHELMRAREGLTTFDPTRPPLSVELSTAKFTILPARDANGATLALFNAHRHDPAIVEHKTTLQGVVYQLDVAMEQTETQRGGLVFIYNMANSKYSNFDYDLSQKMLTLLKGAYPARLKKVLIVTAPLWFKAPFKVLRLFVREKLRDRVYTVSIPQLRTHIPVEAVPRDLGGTLNMDHAGWLGHCLQVVEKKEGELTTMSSSQPTSPTSSPASSSMADSAVLRRRRLKHPTLAQLASLPLSTTPPPSSSHPSQPQPDLVAAHVAAPPPEDEDECASTTTAHNGNDSNGATAAASLIDLPSPDRDREQHGDNRPMSPSDSCSSGGGGADRGGMSLEEFIRHMREKRRVGLEAEYQEIRNRDPTGTFYHARMSANVLKNRYTDVPSYDHSRVILSTEPSDDKEDFINANFVDGYGGHDRAFISTQGPLAQTFCDFWRMIWEQRVQVIVMTTRTVERQRTKCGQYWPDNVNHEPLNIAFSPYVINLLSEDKTTSWDEESKREVVDFFTRQLTVTNSNSGETREVTHFQYVSWPDYGVPVMADTMLNFRNKVRAEQAEMTSKLSTEGLWSGHPMGPPMVVHCSAGIGRTGTFMTIDTAIRKFEDVGRVDIRSTVESIRAQRAFSIQMPEQYVFCHIAFLEWALEHGHAPDAEADLTGFDSGSENEEDA